MSFSFPPNATTKKTRLNAYAEPGFSIYSGDDLLSHRVCPAVPSAQRSLTSEFGMGSGGTSSL